MERIFEDHALKKIRFITGLILFFPLLVYASEADSLLKKLPSTTRCERVEILNELAWQVADADPEQAMDYALEADSILQNVNCPEHRGDTWSRIGLAYDYKGEFFEALLNYRKAVEYFRGNGNRLKLSNSLNNVAGTQYYLGNYEKALEKYSESQKIREALFREDPSAKNELLIAQSLNNVSLVFKARSQFKEAIEMYIQSLEIKRKHNDQRGIITTLRNIGSAYQSMGDYQVALEYYYKGLSAAEKQNAEIEQASFRINIGVIHNKLKEPEIALENFRTAEVLANGYPDKYREAILQISMADAWLLTKKSDSALAHLQKGMTASNESGSLDLRRSAYLTLSEILEFKKDFKGALEAFRNYKTISDSIYNLESTRRAEEISARYELDHKEQEIVMLGERSEQRLRLNITLAALCMLILIASILTIRIIQVGKARSLEQARNQIGKYLKEIESLQNVNLISANSEKEIQTSEKSLPREEVNRYLLNPLSDRELEVMHWIAEGLSNREVGEKLFISGNTVKTHILKIYQKLDVGNRTQAARKARDLDILS